MRSQNRIRRIRRDIARKVSNHPVPSSLTQNRNDSAYSMVLRAHSLWRTRQPVFAVQFSHHAQWTLVAATAANYGICGPGELALFRGRRVATMSTPSGLYDVACNPSYPGLAVAAASSGDVFVFSIASPVLPMIVHKRRVHRGEVAGVSWKANCLASCSWDGTVNVYASLDLEIPVRVFRTSSDAQNHAVAWNPADQSKVAVARSTGYVDILDVRAPSSLSTEGVVIGLQHGVECLTCDWSEQLPLVASGGVDGTVCVWDVRLPRLPLLRMGHGWGVRRIKFRPSSDNGTGTVGLLACGYDMAATIRECDLGRSPMTARVVAKVTEHTEFVMACDWDAACGDVATGGWDGRVIVRGKSKCAKL